MRPPRQPETSQSRRTRTACPHCHGCGAVARSRSGVLSGAGPVWAYEAKPCGCCGGTGWLDGLVPPT